MKRFILAAVRTLPVVWLALSCLTCGNLFRGKPPGSLIVNVSVAEPKTLVPQVSMVPASYDVAGIGPSESAFSVSTATDAVEVIDLELGVWTVTVVARNAVGTAVAEGTGTITLSDDRPRTLEVMVLPIAGTGTIDLQIQWQDEDVASPVVDGQLLTFSGTPIDLVFTISGTTATCTDNTVPTGYHTLAVSLSDGETLVIGAVEVVRIVKGETTAGVFAFTDVGAIKGTMYVSINPDMRDRLALFVSGRLQEISVGGTMSLSASIVNDQTAANFVWYLNGQAQATASGFSVGSDLPTGVHRVDVTAFSADGTRGGSLSHMFSVLYEASHGGLTYSRCFRDGDDDITLLGGARAVALSGDGTHVYVAAYDDSAVLLFDRNPATWTVSYVCAYRDGEGGIDGLYGAGDITIAPDGGSVYVAGYQDNAVTVFSRDPASGELTFRHVLQDDVSGVDGLAGCRRVVVSPDGAHLYATGYSENSVAVFSRDVATGDLTYVSVFKDGVDGAAGLEGPIGIAVSPDGAHLYVAGYTGDTVAVFSRDQGTGLLTFVSLLEDEVGGIDSLNGAQGIVLSADGSAVFVASYYDSTLTVFERDDADGSLTPTAVFRDGADGVDGLRYAREVVLSVDERNLYVTGGSDDAVAVFQRDTVTGNVTFASFLQNGVDGVEGLDSVRGIAVAPDGRNVYVTGSEDNALVVFNRLGD